jgi:uncharacterized repeat protein (TIGR03803 family)
MRSVTHCSSAIKSKAPAFGSLVFVLSLLTGCSGLSAPSHPRAMLSPLPAVPMIGAPAISVSDARSYSERILHKFTGSPDAANPEAGLIRDVDGKLYGTTVEGGANSNCPGGFGMGCGTVFAIDAGGNERVVYSFAGTPDGSTPFADLLSDASGNLYGTTAAGGNGKVCLSFNPDGCGTAFKVDTAGNESILHNFLGYFGSGRDDGEGPKGSLIANPDGALFGATAFGGLGSSGVIFEINTNGKERILHDFDGHGSDGDGSYAGLVRDTTGNLYGTTYQGGGGNCIGGCGSVFELDHAGVFTTLYQFTGGQDGGNPYGGLIMDASGNLYGTAQNYGNLACTKQGGNPGCGTVFKLSSTRTLTVLHTFAGSPDGATPSATLIRDGNGNIYGATPFGGDQSCNGGYSCGVVFKIGRSGRETILHTFTGGAHDGEVPYGGLYRDSSGDLFGTTVSGGKGPCQQGCGIVFELVPAASESAIAR